MLKNPGPCRAARRLFGLLRRRKAAQRALAATAEGARPDWPETRPLWRAVGARRLPRKG